VFLKGSDLRKNKTGWVAATFRAAVSKSIIWKNEHCDFKNYSCPNYSNSII
jgi:hypothetical protein